MTEERLRELLRDVRSGRVSEEEAVEVLRSLPFEDLGFARIDHHRAIRRGFPEVVLCRGKTPEQVVEIARRMVERGSFLATKADREVAEAVRKVLPEVEYHPEAEVLVWRGPDFRRRPGMAAVVSGGSSDIRVAEEAAVTIEAMGHKAERLYDVGVAGIHRLLANWELLRRADVLVVVAGMEGALPSVVGGLVEAPVIAVPTSVGYGASFGGLAALLTMLNSCVPGVMVVNIDNGFGAGYAASLVLRTKCSTDCRSS